MKIKSIFIIFVFAGLVSISAFGNQSDESDQNDKMGVLQRLNPHTKFIGEINKFLIRFDKNQYDETKYQVYTFIPSENVWLKSDEQYDVEQ